MIEIVKTILNLPLINPTTTKKRSYTTTIRDYTLVQQSKMQVMMKFKKSKDIVLCHF